MVPALRRSRQANTSRTGPPIVPNLQLSLDLNGTPRPEQVYRNDPKSRQPVR
jgi:hypothetical protein